MSGALSAQERRAVVADGLAQIHAILAEATTDEERAEGNVILDEFLEEFAEDLIPEEDAIP